VIKSEADNLSGFIQSNVMNLLLEGEFDKIRNELSIFYDTIFDITMTNTKIILDKYFARFPKLKDLLEEIVISYLDDVCRKYINLN